MELKGKKINVLGDSITEGAGVAGAGNIFWQRLGQSAEAVVRGYGIGGTRIARQLKPADPDARENRHFATRVEEMDPDADIVLVFGGTNDFGHGDAPLGRMTDRSDDTFYGACHDLCLKLLNKSPTATIVFLTPLYRGWEGRLVNERGVRNVTDLEGYRQAIEEVASYYSFPVYRWEREVGIQPNIPEVAKRYMPDQLHPNDAGHAIMAARLQAFLENL